MNILLTLSGEFVFVAQLIQIGFHKRVFFQLIVCDWGFFVHRFLFRMTESYFDFVNRF